MIPGRTFFERGWCCFPYDPSLADWVTRTLPAARRAGAAPQNACWLRYQGTWFAGVNVLENDEAGAVDAGPKLAGTAIDFIHETLGLRDVAWDRGQVSVCYPGYPRPMQSESDAVFRYRLNRDAAHVDGLRAEGPGRCRHVREYHGFILGIPMVETSPDASPFVAWERSHVCMRAAFDALFTGAAPEGWGDVDATAAYQAARHEVFATCKRVEVNASPGEAYLVHRLALHGFAPWGSSATAGPDGRMVVYFRPPIGGPRRWLSDP